MKSMVSFRIISDTLNCLEITNMLGINPSISHDKGDENTATTKNGKLITHSPFNSGLWSIETTEEKHQTINGHIKSLLIILLPLKKELLELSARGYKMDIFCGIFTHEVDQPGFIVEPDVMFQLGELNIVLGVCIY